MKSNLFFFYCVGIHLALMLVTIGVLRADLSDVRVGYFAELVLVLQTWLLLDEVWRWRLRHRDYRLFDERKS